MTYVLKQVAFVFPGQGSQFVAMGRDLFAAFPAARELSAEADDVLGYPLTRLVLEGPEEELRRTENTQPALLLVSVAAYRALGLQPAVVAGHSLGEYSALVAAEALSFRDAVSLVHRRGRYMQEAVAAGEGVMVALLGASAEAVRHALNAADGPVDLANFNSPDQIVIAGARDPTLRVAESAGARKIMELAVSAPFHCRLMEPAERRLASDLRSTSFTDPRIPLYANVDARKVTTAVEARDALERQVTRPVRWTEIVERMIGQERIHTFVEVGPGEVLSKLIRRIDRNVRRLQVLDPSSIATVQAELLGGAP